MGHRVLKRPALAAVDWGQCRAYPSGMAKQRKWLIVLALIAAALFCAAAYFLYDGLIHHGPGVVLSGGEYYGRQTDQHWDIVAQKQFRRDRFCSALVCLLTAVCLSLEFKTRWRKLIVSDLR
jgi:hypothetical protein